MSEWISVKEKIPNAGEKVIVLINVGDHKNIESAEYLKDGQFLCCWYDRRGEGCTYTISHWMNRPEDPEVE